MQRIGGEQHAGHAKLGHQPRHRLNLVRRPGQFLMGEDQSSVAGESAEHVNGLAVGQVVETAAQRLAIKSDGARHTGRVSCAQVTSVAAERGFEIVRAECQE